MFPVSTYSRTGSTRSERGSLTASVVWEDDEPRSRPSRPLRPLWPALGAAAIVAALIGGEGSSDDAAPASVPAPTSTWASVDDGIVLPGGARLVRAQAATGLPAAVVVPRSSVALVDGKPMVFVAEPTLRLFAAIPVELGEGVDGDQSITAGLSAGQRIVAGDLAAFERGLQTL